MFELLKHFDFSDDVFLDFVLDFGIEDLEGNPFAGFIVLSELNFASSALSE